MKTKTVYAAIDCPDGEPVPGKEYCVAMETGYWKVRILDTPSVQSGEAVAWHCEGGRGVTVHKLVADDWAIKGFKVTPLYPQPAPSDSAQLASKLIPAALVVRYFDALTQWKQETDKRTGWGIPRPQDARPGTRIELHNATTALYEALSAAKLRIDDVANATNAQPSVEGQEARLVSYATDGATCTLNIRGEEVYFDRAPAAAPVADEQHRTGEPPPLVYATTSG